MDDHERDARGVGASARLPAKGGGGGATLELATTEITPERVVGRVRSGRRMRRHWRLTYAFEEVSADATQVALTLELLECSTLDRATWRRPARISIASTRARCCG